MWRCSEIVWQKHGKLLNNRQSSFRYHNLREKQNSKHIKMGWMHLLSLALFCGLFVRSQNRAGGQRRTWKSNLSPTPLNTPSCWTLSAIPVDSSTRWQMSWKSENFIPYKRRKNFPKKIATVFKKYSLNLFFKAEQYFWKAQRRARGNKSYIHQVIFHYFNHVVLLVFAKYIIHFQLYFLQIK